MNLLSFNKRFHDDQLNDKNVHEVNGYVKALTDVMKYLETVTEFNPAKRMVDAVPLLDSITETNAVLMGKAKAYEIALNSQLNLGSDKVQSFVSEQKGDPNDLKDINI